MPSARGPPSGRFLTVDRCRPDVGAKTPPRNRAARGGFDRYGDLSLDLMFASGEPRDLLLRQTNLSGQLGLRACNGYCNVDGGA